MTTPPATTPTLLPGDDSWETVVGAALTVAEDALEVETAGEVAVLV